MDLNDVKNAIKSVSISHICKPSFNYGENWEEGLTGADTYPQIFMEQPILGSIERDRKTYSFGLVCFINLDTGVDVDVEFDAISRADEILTEIVSKISEDYKTSIAINHPYSTISLNEVTTDEVYGVRADLRITINRDRCIDDKFETNC